MATYSNDCVLLVKASEGTRYVPYDDARPDYELKPGDKIVGTLTCGVGHTGPDVKIGEVWDQARVDSTLRADLDEHARQMDSLVKVSLTQGQYNGLLDWVFEEGIGRLHNSTLLHVLNEGHYDQVPDQLRKWVYAGGKKMAGLVRRREAEIALWSNAPQIAA